MFKIALFGLIAAWIAWAYPFVSNARRLARSRQEVAVTAPAAKFGILLQAIGYLCICRYIPGPRPAGLMVAALLLAALAIMTARAALRALAARGNSHSGPKSRCQPGNRGYPNLQEGRRNAL